MTNPTPNPISEPRACPFCAAKPAMRRMVAGELTTWCITCQWCGFESGLWDSSEQLVEWWNTRPLEDQLAERLAEMTLRWQEAVTELDHLKGVGTLGL